MRRPLSVIVSMGLSAHGLTAPAPVAPSPDALVEKLHSNSYSDREAATRALYKLGEPALPSLDRAASGGDPESRERASRLAGRIRKNSETSALLTAPLVSFDYRDVPLELALADLRVKTRINLVLVPGLVADPHRGVSAKAGPLSPWEAVDAFAVAAGLRELFSAVVPGPDAPRRPDAVTIIGGISSSNYLSETAPPLPGSVPVRLADGDPEPLQANRSSAVRVTVLPPNFPGNRVIRGAGEVVLNLDVAPLPELRWQEISHVRLARIEDETGRPIERAFFQDSPSSSHGDLFIGNNFAGNILVDDGFNALREGGRPNPRLVPIRLRTGDRVASRLRVLEGVVVGEVSLPDQTLVEVPDLAKATGVVYRGQNDARLSIELYESKDSGKFLTIRLRVDGPIPTAFPQFGFRNRIMSANNYPVMPGVGIALAAGLGEARFYDAMGRLLRPPPGHWTTDSPDGFRQIQEIELTFPRSGGLPVRMRAIGSKSVAVEVPIRMLDVPLP